MQPLGLTEVLKYLESRWPATPECYCCRKADPFQGLNLGSCLTLRSELSEETHVLTKQEILWEKAPGGEQ